MIHRGPWRRDCPSEKGLRDPEDFSLRYQRETAQDRCTAASSRVFTWLLGLVTYGMTTGMDVAPRRSLNTPAQEGEEKEAKPAPRHGSISFSNSVSPSSMMPSASSICSRVLISGG